MRVGVSTGEAVVALDARPEEGEGIVTGDVVNTAARLQGAAPVGGVAVSEQTFRATERVFEWELLEAVTVKGKAEPLVVWRPLRRMGTLWTDLTRSYWTPLVGRDLERQLLIGTFERAAQQQSCQLATIVGEPGVGKSRLCTELFAYLEQRPGLVRWRQGRCLPYGEGILFWALGEIVKAECGILESDTPAQAAAKLDRTIGADETDRAWLLGRLAPLVGVPAEPVAQEESFAAWRRFCEGLAAERTTVLVFEDLHWGDPALLAFVEHLAEWAEGVPLLLLCTARPELYERRPTFGSNARNAQRINLAGLTDTETAQLVAALLERAVLPAELQRELLERAGGNPLYAEEFVRLLADRGELGEGTEAPESVQALIAARLDTLPPERKSLLQDASVLGKVFWTGALAAMGGRNPAEVEQALHELARKELVRPARPSSMEGEHEYGFWHVLVRDVCYGQVPRAARASRHQAAAAWIEAKAGERVEDLADLIAHHYQAALELNQAAGIGEGLEQLQAQAVRYLSLAGERALSLDVEQAEHHLVVALELAPAGDPVRAALFERLGQAVQQQGRLQDARQTYEQALERYRDQGDQVAIGRVLTRLGLVLHRLGDGSCVEVLAEAAEVLEAQPHGPELVAAYAYQAGRGLFTGQFPETLAGSERALALAAKLGLPAPPLALMVRGMARFFMGDEQGIDDVRLALQLALEQGLGRESGVIHGNLAGLIWAQDGPEASLAEIRSSTAFCERRGITEIALQHLSRVPGLLAELGSTDEALAEAALAAERIHAGGDMSWLSPRALELSLLAERGAPEQAPDPEPLLAAAREIGLPSFLSDVFAAAAQHFLALDRREQAHDLLRELDQLVPRRNNLVLELPRVVRTALALHDPSLARRLAEGAEPRDPLTRHSLAAAQAQLVEATGDLAEAGRLYADAAERWERFGNVPEHAYALLGHGRCLAALFDPGAGEPLNRAKQLFASMGYKQALAETSGLLGEGEAAAI